jgi:hypothetical protein
VTDVGAGCGWAEEEPGADVVVAQALRDQGHDFALTVGENREAVLSVLGGGALGGELSDQAPGDSRCEQCFPGGDDPNGVQELGGSSVLEQEAACAGLQCLEDVAVGVIRSQDQDPDLLQTGCVDDPPGRLDAIHLRHPDVHEYDVGASGVGLLDRVESVAGFADHLDVVLGVEQKPESRTHQTLVVDE